MENSLVKPDFHTKSGFARLVTKQRKLKLRRDWLYCYCAVLELLVLRAYRGVAAKTLRMLQQEIGEANTKNRKLFFLPCNPVIFI